MQIVSAGIVGSLVRDIKGRVIGKVKKLRVVPESLHVYAIIEGDSADDEISYPLVGKFVVPLSSLEGGLNCDEFVVDFAALSSETKKDSQPVPEPAFEPFQRPAATI